MKATVAPAMVLGLAFSTAALAGDLCIDAQSNPPTLAAPVIIGRGFKIPKKNKCKPFMGVMATSIPARPSAVTGAACTSFDGLNVTFTLVATLPPPDSTHAGTDVRYSARLAVQDASTGTGTMSAFLPTGVVSTGSVVAFECHDAFPDNL
jgi:hypothetical protein